MSPGQQPPFLICVPISQNAAWPGLAAREVEALLDQLGNPAGPDVKQALDASGIIHFLSMAVIWAEDDPDPPVLVVHVAGDGTPRSVIAKLVKHAGDVLLPVFQGAAGVGSLRDLQRLLERGWVKPLAGAWPFWPHRATGLAFQGTPGLTVRRILDDQTVAEHARSIVYEHRAQGFSSALSCLAAARRAAKVEQKSQATSLNWLAPSGAPSASGNLIAMLLSLIVFD